MLTKAHIIDPHRPGQPAKQRLKKTAADLFCAGACVISLLIWPGIPACAQRAPMRPSMDL